MLHAAQITAVAFLTLVLVVGLQAATASLAHAIETDTPTHSDAETLEGDWEDDWWPGDEPMCDAWQSGCMERGWLSACVDFPRERAISTSDVCWLPCAAEWVAVWENVGFSAYSDEWNGHYDWPEPHDPPFNRQLSDLLWGFACNRLIGL